MKYSKFEFTNFKGIQHMLLNLEGPVTTLIGLNESGKTTILEAIFCFTYGAESIDALDPSMASLRDPERWVPIAKRGNFNDTIEIAATVDLDEKDKAAYVAHMKAQWGLSLAYVPASLEIREKYTFENSRLKSQSKTWNLTVSGSKGKQRNPRGFGGMSAEWKSAVEYFKGQLPAIWYFPNFLFELPERFAIDAVAARSEEVDEKNAFYRLTFERVLEQIGSGANLDTHVVDRLKSSDRTDRRSLSALLLEMGREITKTVFEGWNRIFGRAPTAQEVSLEADLDGDGSPFLELKIKGPDGYFDLSERSLGFRWFFMFLLMTSYRGLSHNRSGVVFLLDEPASNLHSSAQAELLKSFASLAESGQIIYTTHSQYLINIRWLDSALVVANEAVGDLSLDEYLSTSTRGRTSISALPYRRFVSDNPSRTSYIQPVLDVLDYQPASIELVPNVAMVEGKSDFYILKYLVDVIGVANQGVGYVPGTGAGTLDCAIRMYVGWSRRFVVLLDGDREGLKQRARYIAHFGPLVEGRCVTVPEMCGEVKALEIEDLFDVDDRDLIIQSVYGIAEPPRYSKKVLLNAIQELYARAEPVRLSTDTMAKLERLVSGLSERIVAD